MIFVGIDAGGTRSRCAAVTEDGTFIGSEEAEGINLHRYGAETSAIKLMALVHSVLIMTGRHDSTQTYVAVCAAGLDTVEVKTKLVRALTRLEPAVHWFVANDAMAAWKGAFQSSPSGVVAISGTGAVALARLDGQEARSGGWGAKLGDEGSGYDLGRRALMAVLRHNDHIGPATSLTDPLLRRLGLGRPDEIIDRVHFQMHPTDIAALAPLVLHHARNGDCVSQELVSSTATALVEFAVGAASAVRGRSDEPLPFAFVGGLSKDPYFHERVRLVSANPRWSLSWQEPAASALVGAVQLSMAQANESQLGIDSKMLLTPDLISVIEESALC